MVSSLAGNHGNVTILNRTRNPTRSSTTNPRNLLSRQLSLLVNRTHNHYRRIQIRFLPHGADIIRPITPPISRQLVSNPPNSRSPISFNRRNIVTIRTSQRMRIHRQYPHASRTIKPLQVPRPRRTYLKRQISNGSPPTSANRHLRNTRRTQIVHTKILARSRRRIHIITSVKRQRNTLASTSNLNRNSTTKLITRIKTIKRIIHTRPTHRRLVRRHNLVTHTPKNMRHHAIKINRTTRPIDRRPNNIIPNSQTRVQIT